MILISFGVPAGLKSRIVILRVCIIATAFRKYRARALLAKNRRNTEYHS